MHCEICRRKYNYTKRQFTVTNPDYWSLVNDYRELKQVANQDPALAEALNEGFVSVWSGVAQPDLAPTPHSCAHHLLLRSSPLPM